jgi:uncharacterized RDD family membrane protein YckC
MASSAPASIPAPAPASRARRLAALLYEGVLLFGVVFIADYLFDTLTQSRHGLVLRDARQAWLFVVLGTYFIWFWTHGGQTLAMKTWHVALVGPDSRPPRWPTAVLRYALIWLPLVVGGLSSLALPLGARLAVLILCASLPYLWSLLDREQQFLHDRLLGTRLVLRKKPTKLQAQPAA